MLLPVLFYVWILGLGLGAHCKPAHRVLSLLTFVLALGLALAVVPSTVTALPTPVPRSVGLVVDHHQLTARNETIAALENTSTVTPLVSYEQTSEAAKRQDGENCIVKNGIRTCLNPVGGNPCEQFPSRKCPPPKKGSNPGGGGPGHNATAEDDLIPTHGLAALTAVAATESPTTLATADRKFALASFQQPSEGAHLAEDDENCIIRNGIKECLNPHGGKPCELYPSRKCPPPKKKGGSPGGGAPGHNATAQDPIATQELTAAKDRVAAEGSTVDVEGRFEPHATINKPDSTDSVKLDEAVNVQPSASLSGTAQAKAALATVVSTPLKEDEGGEGCVWVGNVRKCGRHYGPITNPCEQYPSRKCPPAKKKGGSPGGGPGHNVTASQDLFAAEKLATAKEVVAVKGYATARDLIAKRRGAATADGKEGSGGPQLHLPADREPGARKAGIDGVTAPELTMAESKSRTEQASLLKRAFVWLSQAGETVKRAESTVLVDEKGGPVKTDRDEEHH